MTHAKFILATLATAFGLMSAMPAMAHDAPERHKVCHSDRHHHRTCHWVR